MTRIQEIEQRVDALEDKMNVVIDLINDFIELVYEPSFVKKIDKLAKKKENGKEEA